MTPTLARQACPLCGGCDAVTLCTTDGKTGRPLNTVACRGFTLARVDPLPSAEELAAYYGEAYRSDYKGVVTPKLKHVWRAAHAALDRLRWVAPLLDGAPVRRVLDIGSGGGEWVALLARRGWQASGLEPHRGYGEFARQAYGADVSIGTLWDAPVTQTYEAVTSFHVLEHLRDPVDGLRRMAAWVAPGGRLVIEVPNVLYPGGAPGNTFFRAHLFHFSPETLARCGEAAGLRVLWTDPQRRDSALRIAFGCPAAPPASAAVAAASLDEVLAANRQRTWLRYLLSRQAPAKLAGRLRRIRHEAGLAGRFADHAALLDAVYRAERRGGLPPGGVGPQPRPTPLQGPSSEERCHLRPEGQARILHAPALTRTGLARG